MNVIFLTLFSLSVLLSEGRLLDRSTERTKDTTDNPKSEHKIKREISEEELTAFIEETFRSRESHSDSNKRLKYSFRPRHKTQIKTRIPRDSEEKFQNENNKTSNNHAIKVLLVKKPIPKFTEIDNNDFQTNLNKLPIKSTESADHEDEDFNVNDYDFDVNHDEYSSKGKLLEPNVKVSQTRQNDQLEQSTEVVVKLKPAPPIIKKQSKLIIPTSSPSSNHYMKRKKTTSNISEKVLDKPKEIDYYDDVSTSTKAVETKRESKQRDYEEYTEDSKEYDHKPRKTRSLSKRELPNKIQKKSPQILSILPMFPSLPMPNFTNPDPDIPKIEFYDILEKTNV